MLTDCAVMATIPASDLDRAIRWYDEKLGFKPVMETEGGVMYQAANGTGFFIYPTPNAGEAPQTLMSFLTPDVTSEVRDLKALGVVFEEYDLPGMRTVDSIASMPGGRGGWFRDSEGNIIGVFEMQD
ncbi:MAG: VOC family protein [Bauldia sp.]|uniref:VOC family protein n=1 Tax=Bauldia sp. TaxID=2575872 RepID=UPI001DA70C1F|nr:VOC family protein [Bauldia sp.]MCB1494213.1 VOC family protein [Bauldia sp.]